MTEKEQLRVLITDDNHTMRLMIRSSLEEAGFHVIEAENGKQALEIFSESQPDAILLDVEMPIMDGITACREFRNKKDATYTPIMMVTSRDDSLSINKAFEAGATEFTVKPINWEILGHRVRYMIRNNQDYIALLKSKKALSDAQNEIKQINIGLEKRVAERTEKLKNTTNELQNTLDKLRNTQKQLIESEKTSVLSDLMEVISEEALSPIIQSIQSINKLT